MTNPDADHRAIWRERPVAALLFMATWSGLLACWAMGLTPTGEWPTPLEVEPPQLSGAAWWSRFRWAMALPAVLTAAGIVIGLRRPRSAGGPANRAGQRADDRVN
jgi:hypothetical protein